MSCFLAAPLFAYLGWPAAPTAPAMLIGGNWTHLWHHLRPRELQSPSHHDRVNKLFLQLLRPELHPPELQNPSPHDRANKQFLRLLPPHLPPELQSPPPHDHANRQFLRLLPSHLNPLELLCPSPQQCLQPLLLMSCFLAAPLFAHRDCPTVPIAPAMWIGGDWMRLLHHLQPPELQSLSPHDCANELFVQHLRAQLHPPELQSPPPHDRSNKQFLHLLRPQLHPPKLQSPSPHDRANTQFLQPPELQGP